MCPIWPLHLVILYLLAICPMWVLCQNLPTLTATFLPVEVELNMDYTTYVDVTVNGSLQSGDEMLLFTDHEHIAKGSWNSTYTLTEEDAAQQSWSGRLRVYGNFLGRTEMAVSAKRGTQEIAASGALPVTVVRPQRVIDSVFVSSVALFVSLIFINFGCAMDWPTVRGVLRKPVGPAIGMVGQFLFMPLMSFGLGFLIFPNAPAMRLGMFFTGVSPGGGASNIWTFILGGNLNLSLAMTSVSTLACFAIMPAWLFSLGQVVFANASIVVPYTRIASFVIGLIVPLAIGLGMQKWTPKLAAFMVRILKGFSTTLLLFIIIFAIVTNLYIFELFTWEIVVAGMGLPWLGYTFGYLFARALKQPHADSLAISIETGIQNTGISIFLLRYALPQPEADLTTVVPVSVAIMTPIPMTCIYIAQKIRAWCPRVHCALRPAVRGETRSATRLLLLAPDDGPRIGPNTGRANPTPNAAVLTPGFMPAFSPTGVRLSALSKRPISDRINDASLPSTRRLFLLKRAYKNRFSAERLERIDRYIEITNATLYAKLANTAVDLKKQTAESKDSKKKKPWTDGEWKKHMDYIGQIAGPRKIPEPDPIDRGPKVPLAELMVRIREISYLPEFKFYKRMSQEDWYKDPSKVSPAAMKYEISARLKEISKPKAAPPAD